jgi:hypothetical protein
VTEKFEHEGKRCVRLQLATANQDGMTKLAGDALIAWP